MFTKVESHMSRMIEITVSSKGETKLETRGFTGTSCRDASRLLEAALGHVTNDQPTAEFYQSQASQCEQHVEND
jgi:hypothetical protein